MRPVPSTDQLLRSCADQISALIPKLSDETDQAAAGMVVVALGNCAIRSANEIAWMHQEATDYREFAGHVARETDDAGLLQDSTATGAASLHLAAVSDDYLAASRLMSRAVRLALASGREDLIARAEELLDDRLNREEEVRAAYADVGR